MAAGVFVVSWALGFFYLRGLELHGLSHTTVWTAWTILCACQALNVWATVWTCLLQGVGYIGWDALIASFISAGMLIAQIIVVLFGGGIVTLAAIGALAGIFQRSITRWFARRRRPELFALRGTWNRAVLQGMPGLALRAWLTAIGTILVQNTDSFFIASAQGAQNIPAFRAAFVVVLNLHMLAAVFASSSTVFISHLWQAGQITEVQRIVQRNLRFGLCIVLCGSAAILAAGESLFNAWLGPSNYVGYGIVALFVAMFVLEQQTFIISTGCRATEHEAFAGWMLAGGLLKLLLAYLLMKRFGVAGLAAGTLIAQLLTAHWFVLYRGLHRLQFGFNRYLMSVLIPCLLVFAAAWFLSFCTVTLAGPVPDWAKLGGASLATGLVLVTAMWLLVLDPHQRIRAIEWIGVRLPRASLAPK
jgi:O-antigen/teichoic acid export membrane protein